MLDVDDTLYAHTQKTDRRIARYQKFKRIIDTSSQDCATQDCASNHRNCASQDERHNLATHDLYWTILASRCCCIEYLKLTNHGVRIHKEGSRRSVRKQKMTQNIVCVFIFFCNCLFLNKKSPSSKGRLTQFFVFVFWGLYA